VVDSPFVMRLFRRFLCLLLLAGWAVAATSARSKTTRPNVILITLDTTRADRMGFLGSQRGLTPNLDVLARQAVVFTRAYAHVPLTTASHATILTGTYPQFNHVNDFGLPLAKDLPYLPAILHEHGYTTAAFVGSAILDPLRGSAPGFDRGFDVYDAGFRNRRPGDDRYRTLERRADDVVARSLTWLSKNSGGPFFLWVHLYDAHAPYEPPEPFQSRYASAPYDGEIAYADSVVGKLLDQLRRRRLYDGALIAVMADHGEAFGEHGEFWHGVFLYDETIHVPVLFKMPKERFGGRRIDVRIGLVDVAPTILQVAGLPAPKALQGESLVPIVNPTATGSQAGAEGTTDKNPDRPAYAETDYSHRAFGWSSLRTLRSGKYLFVEAPRKEVYDEPSDPRAERNLASTAAAVTETLTSQLDAFRRKTSSSTAAPSVDADPQREQHLAALGYVGSSGKAEAPGTELVGADPKDKIEIANRLTDALLAVEDAHYKQAIPVLQQVLAQQPNISAAYLALGTAWTWLKDYQNAVPALRKAVELRPDSLMAHYELGLALFETGNLEAAAPQFEAAVARAPRWADLHFSLAAIYARIGRAADAEKELKTTVQLKPDDYRANLMLGRLLALQGNPAGGLNSLRKAARLQPNSPEVHLFLADAYTQLGQEQNARRERAEAERLGPSSQP
jgi:choline-sulfatase